MQTRGEGVKNPKNFADVICACPLNVKFNSTMSPLPSFRRSMLLHLLDASFNLGYRPAVSADVSAKYATDSDGNPGGPFNSRLNSRDELSFPVNQ